MGQIFTSMTIYTSHSLEAYPITTPPPKRVSDRMFPAAIHEYHLHGEHSKFLIAKKSETNLCRNAAARKTRKKPGSIFHRPPPHRPLLAGADFFQDLGPLGCRGPDISRSTPVSEHAAAVCAQQEAWH